MSAKKTTNKATTQKNEISTKAKWNTLGENNLMYNVNAKGILLLRVDLNKAYKPSKSFYNQSLKRKTNILIASTSGNKQLLDGEYSDMKISVNVYRQMTSAEVRKWEKKT